MLSNVLTLSFFRNSGNACCVLSHDSLQSLISSESTSTTSPSSRSSASSSANDTLRYYFNLFDKLYIKVQHKSQQNQDNKTQQIHKVTTSICVQSDDNPVK